MEKSNRLDNIPLFQGLSKKLLETISKKALVKTYRAGAGRQEPNPLGPTQS